MSSIEEKQSRGQHGTLQDGRTIAKSQVTEIVTWHNNITPPIHLTVYFPQMNLIDAILDVNIKTVSPPACVFGICQKQIGRHVSEGYPVVGFTVVSMTYISSGLTATGVTVTAEAVVIGW